MVNSVVECKKCGAGIFGSIAPKECCECTETLHTDSPKRTVTEYVIVKGFGSLMGTICPDAKELEKNVNAHHKDGWRLYGPPILGHNCFYQAMIREVAQ